MGTADSDDPTSYADLDFSIQGVGAGAGANEMKLSHYFKVVTEQDPEEEGDGEDAEIDNEDNPPIGMPVIVSADQIYQSQESAHPSEMSAPEATRDFIRERDFLYHELIRFA